MSKIKFNNADIHAFSIQTKAIQQLKQAIDLLKDSNILEFATDIEQIQCVILELEDRFFDTSEDWVSPQDVKIKL